MAVDSSVLRRLAQQGVAGGSDLRDVSTWCRDYGEATGDARYSSLGDTFRSISEWMTENDEAGGVPATLMGEVNQLIRTWLPDILDASPSDGAVTARVLREEVSRCLLPPEAWP